jgi:ABC-type polysaccharide transport system permease subunit
LSSFYFFRLLRNTLLINVYDIIFGFSRAHYLCPFAERDSPQRF